MKNKENIITLFIIYVVILYVVLHLGYFIETSNNFKISEVSNFGTHLYTVSIQKPFIFLNTITNKKYTLNLAIVFTFVFFVYTIYRIDEKRKYDRKGVEHGSASWGRLNEYTKLKEKKFSENMILSENIRISFNGRKTHLNNNVIIFGSTGTGKTRNFLTPNILQGNSSFVVTDPKGSIYKNTKDFLLKKDYQVKVFDLVNISQSNHYNPFKYLETEEDVLIFIDNIILNTDGEKQNQKGDPFWEHSQKALLACIIFVLWRADEKYQNFVEVLNCVHNFGQEEFYLTDFMIRFQEKEKNDGVTDISLLYYRTLMLASTTENTLKLVLMSTAVKLSIFVSEPIKNLMSYDELEIETLGLKKTALFIILPDTNKTFNCLASVLYTQLFQKLISMADNEVSERLKVPVSLYLDEFANTGKIPDFEVKLATIRSRGISATIILQSLGQLKSLYKDDWETIIGNCDSLIFLGSTEKTLLEYLSIIFGKETTNTRNRGITKSKNNSSSQNDGIISRELITIDELLRLEENQCIVSIRRHKPFLDEKYNLKKHKNYKKLNESKNKKFFKKPQDVTDNDEIIKESGKQDFKGEELYKVKENKEQEQEQANNYAYRNINK